MIESADKHQQKAAHEGKKLKWTKQQENHVIESADKHQQKAAHEEKKLKMD